MIFDNFLLSSIVLNQFNQLVMYVTWVWHIVCMGKMSDAYTYMSWNVWREECKEYVGEKYKKYIFEGKVFQGAECM